MIVQRPHNRPEGRPIDFPSHIDPTCLWSLLADFTPRNSFTMSFVGLDALFCIVEARISISLGISQDMIISNGRSCPHIIPNQMALSNVDTILSLVHCQKHCRFGRSTFFSRRGQTEFQFSVPLDTLPLSFCGYKWISLWNHRLEVKTREDLLIPKMRQLDQKVVTGAQVARSLRNTRNANKVYYNQSK